MDPKIQLADWAHLRHQHDHQHKNTSPPTALLKRLQADIIAALQIQTPLFGPKKSIYTDFFASSKPLQTFESIIQQAVLPFYANTHTSTTSTSKYTSKSVQLARDTVARCTNAIVEQGHEHQAVVIFSGNGSTSAINKIRNVFRLNDEAYWIRNALATHDPSSYPCPVSSSHSLSWSSSQSSRTHLAPQHRPVVFLSIQEHHSNLLPWRESCADVVVIPECSTSHQLDLEILEQQLILHQRRPLKLGTFSAGSNLTGVLNDTVAISELLHKYGAFAFYDYAGVGPYTTIDMNPLPSSHADMNAHSEGKKQSLAYKDGVFISTHKFLGGPGASGVLVARLEVFGWIEQHNALKRDKNEYIPATPGGGTVDMVIQGRHKYTNNVLAREEAGTPNILATIRTGLVFRLQEIMDPEWILQEEYRLAKKILARLTAPKGVMSRSVHVLGISHQRPHQDRIAVFSLTMAVPRFRSKDQKRPLQIHYALLSTLMNDFFGVEMRGGCMCAGPYASQLLCFDADTENKFWNLLLGQGDTNDQSSNHPSSSTNNNIHQQNLRSKSLKPGFVRFSFSYFAKDKDVEFVIQSLEWMAQYGYLLIPLYQLNASTGEWSVRDAVRKIIYSGIQSKRKSACASRRHCIPAAVDCIHGLKKLFQEQLVVAADRAAITPPSSPHSPCALHSVTIDSSSISSISSGSHHISAHVVRSVHTVRSAQRFLTRLLNPHYPAHAVSSAHQMPISPPNSEHHSSDDENDRNDDRDRNHDRSRHDELQVNASGSNISALPDANNYVGSLPLTNQREQTWASASSSVSSILMESHLDATNPNSRGTSKSAAVAERKSIKAGLLSTARPSEASMFKNRSGYPYRSELVKEALQELSWSRLQREVDAVETSELAKELNWFLTPLQVARVYVQELTNPGHPDSSSPSTSLFPKRKR
ncbi:hypothetical protein EDD11_007463 [Mortierella claussenii]|nr:hypothetical protein EDD11_007463 [Mortierella claussenii]